MALNLTQLITRDRATIHVSGTMPNAPGTGSELFSFTLRCRRLDADALQARLDEGVSMADFLAGVVEDWSGVTVDDGQAWPYSPQNLRALCEAPGMANVMLSAYLQQQGARAKN